MLPKAVLKKLYISMLRIRLAQDRIAEIYPQEPRLIQCPVHLCTGHEAIPAGVCASLSLYDHVFGPLRCHGHYLAKGGSLPALFAELFGKKTGCSGGKGGSMHLTDLKKGFIASSGIVAATIPIAVGSAFAFKMKQEKRVAAVFFGDSACEEGVWHESLNFAALKKLPIIFICENNFYAIKSSLSARQPLDNIFARAQNYGLPGVRVDGNNILAVYEAARAAVSRARRGLGPTLIEARTYRWRQHCENTFFDKDLLEGRPKKEYEAWLKKCPVKFFERYLLKNQVWSKSDLEKINKSIEQEIDQAVKFAQKSPFPGRPDLISV